MAKLRLMPYPGAKTRHVDWITEQFPNHDAYIEPFGGTAAVLLNKPRSKVEIYNDLNEYLTTLLTVLRDDSDELANWLEQTPYSRELHDEYRERLYGDGEPPDDDVKLAGMTYYLQYSSFGGKIDDAFMVPNYNTSDGNWRRRAKPYVDHVTDIPALSARLQGVVVEQMDFSDVLDRYDSPTALFYLDPPYADKGYYADRVEHADLFDRLTDLEGAWILSLDRIPEQLDEYDVVTKSSSHAIDARKQSEEISECLIMDDATEPGEKEEWGQKMLSDYA